MKRSGRPLARIAATVALGILIPACSNGTSTTTTPSGTVFLNEQFAAFPNPTWTVTGAGVASLDSFAGNPQPCLMTTPGGSTPASLVIQSTVQFGGADLTFSADIDLVEVGPGLGGGRFVIRDSSSNSPIATVTWDAQMGTILFTIGTDVSSSMGIVPAFHTFSFTYDSAGTATWKVGGSSFFSVAGFHPPVLMVVSLENTSVSVFEFDNVIVTSP